MKRSATVVSTVVLLTALLSACSGSVSPRFGGGEDELQPGYEEYVDDSQYVDDSEPTDAEIDEAMREANERVNEWLDSNGGDADGWSCYYDPTMNDDWHDDAMCTDGTNYDRPYLREWDDFVTRDELMESATEYAAQLNG